jgi:hypothetical protein
MSQFDYPIMKKKTEKEVAEACQNKGLYIKM